MNTVCQTCGDCGFEEALVYCGSCKIMAIHRYCLGITPVPFTEHIAWICEGCNGTDTDCDFKEVDQTAKLRHILNNNDTKKKKKSVNHTPPSLAHEDHGFQDATNVEPLEVHSSEIKQITEDSKRRKSLDNRKLNDSTVLATDGPSVPKAVTPSRLSGHNACTTKKRKLSSTDIPLTSENKQLADGNSPCKEVEPTTPAMLMSRHCKVQPIETPIWRGLISVKGEQILRLDGITAHISSLACPRVHETARSLHSQLNAEMFPRLKIWPKSFLKSGGPKNESIALFLFPSSESNDVKVFYSLVLEMKNNDLGMRCVLHDAELLLFTSNMLPTDSWNSKSDGYLWGVFKRR